MVKSHSGQNIIRRKNSIVGFLEFFRRVKKGPKAGTLKTAWNMFAVHAEQFVSWKTDCRWVVWCVRANTKRDFAICELKDIDLFLMSEYWGVREMQGYGACNSV